MPEDPDPAYDATVAPSAQTVTTPRLHIGGDRSPSRPALPSYTLGAILGRGGMGDVMLAQDPTIGREVAIKRMHAVSPSPEMVSRFLREARIQARLEHPAIVPVHQLGYDDDGHPYFTMKRVTGVTFAQSLAATPPPPRQRLLRIFTDVCRAIEFAHMRGVVHRDLKPANIMLGEYGEVYVLDWGLARVVGEVEPATPPSIGLDVASLEGATQAGALLGTPGYMSPEQAEGASAVGPRADVYSLGSLLYEILAGEALHPRGLGPSLASTLAPTDGFPSHRRPDREIAPELDALCALALARDPTQRMSASELADGIEGYLDGDRDLERRRALAAEQIAAARTALDSGDATRRGEAMRSASRALAFDQTSTEAADLVTSMMFEVPPAEPAELTAELIELDASVQQRQSRVARMSFVVILGFVVLAAINGLENWPFAAVIAVVSGLLMAFAWRLSQRPARAHEMVLTMVGNALLAALLSRTFGSIVIAPAVTCIMAVSLTSYPHMISRGRVVIALLVLSWIVPVLLEQLGVLATTWVVRDGLIESTSDLVRIGGVATTSLLIVANVATIVTIGVFANTLARTRRDAQRQVTAQAWHLRQLLPLRKAPTIAPATPTRRA